jgi:hypothetical protein
MSKFSSLARELDEAIATPISVIGGPRRNHVAPNVASVDLAKTRDYSELLALDGVEAKVGDAHEDGETIDVDAEDELENESETNWASDAIDEAASISDLSKVISAMLSAPSFDRRAEALIKKSGVSDAEEVKSAAVAFREALMVHLLSIVPLAMRDVGVDVGGARVNRAKASLKRAANEEKRHDRRLARLAEELRDTLS